MRVPWKKIPTDDPIKAMVKKEVEKKEDLPLFHPGVDKMKVDVEKLKALAETSIEMREITEERFNRLMEEIGELRHSISEVTKEVGKVNAKAEMASDLVKEVEPEKIRVELLKSDTQVKKLEAKLSTYDRLIQSVLNEAKDLRKRTAMIKDTEDLIKLNNESREKLMNMQSIESKVDTKTDRINKIFLNFQKEFSEFQQFKGVLRKFSDYMKDMEKRYNDIGIKLTKLENLEEFKRLYNSITNERTMVENLVKQRTYFEKINRDIKQTMEFVLQNQRNTETLKQYINASLKREVDKETIKNNLLDMGWSKSQIEAFL